MRPSRRGVATAMVLALAGVACGSSGGGGGGSASGGRGGNSAMGSGGAFATGGATGGTTAGGSGGAAGATGGATTAATGGTGGTGGNSATGGAGGGTPGDAGRGGSTGGAAGAGTTGGGGSSGGCATASFCDDFERGAMLGPEWTLDNSTTSNTIEVVSDKAHSGTNSVHIKYGTGAMATYFDAGKGFPFPNDAYWGRVWMYAMTGLEGGHHVFIEARVGGGGDHTGVRALNTQNNGMVATNLESNDQGGTSKVALPQGTWTCFEWHIAGGAHLYMNGTEVPGTAQTNWTIPHMMKQRLGIQRYSGGSAGELWYDDYAVGSARIGCD